MSRLRANGVSMFRGSRSPVRTFQKRIWSQAPLGSLAAYAMRGPSIEKLVIGVDTKNDSGTSTSTNETFVAESGGKLVIPVPVPAK